MYQVTFDEAKGKLLGKHWLIKQPNHKMHLTAFQRGVRRAKSKGRLCNCGLSC